MDIMKNRLKPITDSIRELVPKWRYIDLCPSWECDARCPTCNAWKRDAGAMTHNQAMQIACSFPDCKTLIIEGGEPTRWQHLNDFVNWFEVIHEKCNITIITNGIDTENVLNKAESMSSRINFLISFNGFDDIHSQSRGVKGATEATLSTAMELKMMGFNVAFSYVPFQENYSEYEKIVEYCKKEGMGFGLCYPVKSGKFGDKGLRWELITDEQKDAIFAKHINSKRGYSKMVYDMFYQKARAKQLMPCLAGRSMLHINPQGIIRPCHLDETREIGRVGEDSIQWHLDKIKQYRKEIPASCMYANGDLCNDCFPIPSLFRSPGFVLKNKVGL